jgi:hypothetical protein
MQRYFQVKKDPVVRIPEIKKENRRKKITAKINHKKRERTRLWPRMRKNKPLNTNNMIKRISLRLRRILANI